ncbi:MULTISPECIES: hypothetical protein [Actinomycetes]|uniref:Uncharacterized protein n=1 Tax=Luedemannella helvata TaxID=349315 RepID=A0ABP4XIB5_9ACTN|nr:hypothetical protein [Streptomyces virginiae]
MSHIMPDRVANLIPSQRPKPADPTATSDAVRRFSAKRRPLPQITAASVADRVDAEMFRFRGPLLSVEDQGDREMLLAEYAAADKVLSGVALRQSTAVLS